MTPTTDPLLRPESGACEVWLIRHGDAVRGADDVSLGSYDQQGLSVLGRRQAAALAAALESIDFAAIYASPVPRAFQTAEALAGPRSIPVHADPELREVDLTAQRPMIADDVPSTERALLIAKYLRWMEQQALSIGDWDKIIAPGTSLAVRSRILAAVDGLAARHAGERIAIASHAGAINAYIAEFLGVQRDFFFPIVNTAITIVRVRPPHHLLVELNNTAHLVAAGLGRGGQPRT